tara:strand:+ start:10378 stop:11211 length:834 start_codon:yes stop_codon:yes gene_type:complete
LINSKKINFIIGSGRCGTRSFYRMLAGEPNIDIHHEYRTVDVQQIAVLYYTKMIDFEECCERLKEIYNSAIHYSNSPVWIDSSNKCSWLIDVLHEIYPEANFLALIRDGRKVVSSFYYKLREEIYDDESCTILNQWLMNSSKHMPPLEKPYWWNIPVQCPDKYNKFSNYDRFERVCFHWNEINNYIESSFKNIPKNQKMYIRFEDLVADNATIDSVCEFLSIKKNKMFYDFLQKPRNVFYPLNYQLGKSKIKKFDKICKDTMKKWGYDNSEEYVVKY